MLKYSNKINKFFCINIFFLIFISFKSELYSAKITYEFSGGRFGDNLVAYCHAKWLSFKNEIPVLYQPFEFSDQLAMHYLEERIKLIDIKKKILIQKNLDLQKDSNSIYSVPYFGEDLTEHRTNPQWIYFQIDWNNPEFKKQIQKSIDPINSKLKNINLSKDYINIAVHIRRGGGYDHPFSDSNIKANHYVDIGFPLKFPPLTFYIEQIKKISEIFKHAKLYVYVFTDDQNPDLLVARIKDGLPNYNNIIFDFRKQGNVHNKNVLEDFFAMTQFDCLIASQSNFSFMARKISNYEVEIFPTDYIKENKIPVINKIKIVYKNQKDMKNLTDLKINQLNKQINYKKKHINDPKNRQGSYPHVSGDSFRGIADHLFDETNKSLKPEKVKTNDIVFLKTDYMKEFFSSIHPKIKNKYILITHNSDLAAPGAYESFLNDPKIIKWLGMNPTIKNNDKFIPIPIGIANRYVPHGNVDTFNNLIKNKNNNIKKTILLGMNFNQTNAKERDTTKFSQLEFCKDLRASPHSLYLEKMASTKFILSPMGNGLDCHRTWEALLVGTIPILITSNLDPMLEDLPVLIINNWDELTEEYLNDKYQDFIKTEFNNDKIFFDYWFKLIESFKN